MNKILYLMTAAAIVCASCGVSKQESDNPLLKEWDTPFNVPPFSEISIEHFKPAVETALAEHNAEIDAIINNKKEADFENTIVALDKAGSTLSKVYRVFGSITSANTNDEYQALNRELTPIISKHSNNISLNEDLFAKVKAVYDKRESLNLDAEQLRTTEKIYNDFARNGAALPAEEKVKLKEINEKLSMLYLQFGENTLNETNEFKLFVESEDELKGLPEAVKATAAAAAKADGQEGKWLFKANRVSMTPVFMYAENRELRKALYNGYYSRGHNDNAYNNETVIKDMVNLRVEKAHLLGYKSFADYKLDNNMAKTFDASWDFLIDLWTACVDVMKTERADQQEIANADNIKIEPWDWWFYTEKVRKAKFDLDAEAIKPYFELERVRNAAFGLATRLYGVTFKESTEYPILMDEVKTFEIFEEGKQIGLLYMDFHPRDGKRSGAWCGGYRNGSYDAKGDRIFPIVNIVCNFTRPSGDTPALLSIDEVQTLFHEFGHGLHGLFSDGSYDRISGDMPRDMIELPSQIMENWSMDPEYLKTYAVHYKTNEVIPDDVIAKINASSAFNQGFITGEYLAAALLDLKFHSLTEVDPNLDVDKFEKETLAELGLIPEMLPRYRSGFFNHAFGGDGYSAGYYVYIWAAVLDADAFMYIKNSGDLYNKEIAAKFRKYILAGSGQGEAMDQYRKFRGQDPSVESLKKIRGLDK